MIELGPVATHHKVQQGVTLTTIKCITTLTCVCAKRYRQGTKDKHMTQDFTLSMVSGFLGTELDLLHGIDGSRHELPPNT